VVPGNHDLFSAGKFPVFNAGIEYPENWFNMDINDQKNLMKEKIWLYENETRPDLTAENIQYLNSLSEYHVLNTGDYNFLLSHFLYPDISGSLRKRIDELSVTTGTHFGFMRQNNCILSFGGHMHKEGFEVVNITGLKEFSFQDRRD
jgi:calcineurin-like phosphoesterase family protein